MLFLNTQIGAASLLKNKYNLKHKIKNFIPFSTLI